MHPAMWFVRFAFHIGVWLLFFGCDIDELHLLFREWRSEVAKNFKNFGPRFAADQSFQSQAAQAVGLDCVTIGARRMTDVPGGMRYAGFAACHRISGQLMGAQANRLVLRCE